LTLGNCTIPYNITQKENAINKIWKKRSCKTTSTV